MSETSVEKELGAMNAKLDILISNQHLQDVRIAKIEVEAGYFKLGLGLIVTMVTGLLAWALKKVFG